jgi:hypothetical protein
MRLAFRCAASLPKIVLSQMDPPPAKSLPVIAATVVCTSSRHACPAIQESPATSDRDSARYATTPRMVQASCWFSRTPCAARSILLRFWLCRCLTFVSHADEDVALRPMLYPPAMVRRQHRVRFSLGDYRPHSFCLSMEV